jgi:hypothetical protein
MSMFRARTAGPDAAVEPDGRPVADGRPADASRREVRRDDATGANAGGQALGLLSRVLQVVISIVVLIIVAGILLVVFDANADNTIVSHVHDWAQTLAGPFDGMFTLDSADGTIAVNWGIAAAVYLLAGAMVLRLIGRTSR